MEPRLCWAIAASPFSTPRRRAISPWPVPTVASGSVSTARSTTTSSSAAELATRGHEFRTGTDTEVLLAAFAEWGTDMLPRLVGMFAFALLDLRDRRLVLARDAFGIKPLYYTWARVGMVFASEVAPCWRSAICGPGSIRRSCTPTCDSDSPTAPRGRSSPT